MMAQVNIQSIIEALDYDMKRALEDALMRISPTTHIDRTTFYKEFYKAVGRKCSTWVNVNNRDVRMKCPHCEKQV